MIIQGNSYGGTIEIKRVGLGWVITEKPSPHTDRSGRQWTRSTYDELFDFIKKWSKGELEDPIEEKSE